MPPRPFGSTGLAHFPLGFGCMRLPKSGPQAVDRPAAVALLRDAMARGIDFFDSAWIYHGGESEGVLGEALAGHGRDRVTVSTKCPVWEARTPADFDRLLGESLDRLRTDHVDLYLLHALNHGTWPVARDLGALEFLERAKADGRIRFTGFSFHDGPELFREIAGAHPWDATLLQFNYMDEHFQAGLAGVRHAKSLGFAVMAMEPLRGGRLVKQVPPEVTAIWRTGHPTRTPADWALRWVLDHAEVDLVLSGMGTIDELDENFRVAAGTLPGALTAAERATVGRARDWYRDHMKVHCTECGYCFPCPNGVAITAILDIVNSLHVYGANDELVAFYKGFIEGGGEGAGKCDGCGACEARCPQGVPIREILAEAVQRFGAA